MTIDLSAIIAAIALALGGFNLFVNLRIKNAILEVQLNLRREFNGRYETLAQANDTKERLNKLEDKVYLE